ncbi:MAG: hypothetical protein ACW991_03900, partial [Candidatus Hodarchaeales archaeon]
MEGKTHQERHTIHREKLYTVDPTPITELEELETKFARKNLNSVKAVLEWFREHKFQILIVSGELKHADVQVSRRKDEGRYHWRLYMYPDRLIVEIHIDQVDPGKRFGQLHKNGGWLKNSTDHFLKDVIQKPDHHYIIKHLTLSESDIKLMISELHSHRWETWLESKLGVQKK